MQRRVKRKVYSFLFLSIFFIKVLLALAPLYAHWYNKQQVADVIMQLELDDHSDTSDGNDLLAEKLAKEFPSYLNWSVFVAPLHYLSVKFFINDDSFHLKSFYPTVPTPPPNC